MTGILMKSPTRAIVDKMFDAFIRKDLPAAQSTVTDDTLWVHNGSQKMPAMRFVGKSGTEKFFHTAFTSIVFDYFRPLKFIEDGDTIAVLGEESFRQDGGEKMINRWVQIYTIRDGLIARMDEYATSASDGDYMAID